MTKKTKIVAIGGGFTGIRFVRKSDDFLFDVLLIDKINYYQFQPLLYQLATSQIKPSAMSFPLHHIFRNKKNVQIRLTEVIGIDEENKKMNAFWSSIFATGKMN